jgi:protein tyrosine phosphatase
MLTSNNYSLPGHVYRINYMNNNKQYLDIFGRGHNDIQFTDEAFINYMFTVSMENDTSDAYFTERLTSPMTTYTIPIYRGSKAVTEQYFNPKGILWEDEIELKDLNENLYSSMLPYIEENFKLACEFPVADDYIAENYFI